MPDTVYKSTVYTTVEYRCVTCGSEFDVIKSHGDLFQRCHCGWPAEPIRIRSVIIKTNNSRKHYPIPPQE